MADLEAKRAVFRRQFRELMDQGHASVTCGCGRSIPVRFAYHCYFCGLWFCPACARVHFGERPQHNEDELKTMEVPMPERLIYLAAPYTAKLPDGSRDEATERARVTAVTRLARDLLLRGLLPLSPLTHGQPIADKGFAGDWRTWERLDSELLRRCDEVWVCTLPGWEDSRGVMAEILLAGRLGKPVRFVDALGNEVQVRAMEVLDA